ncbi:tetratricopeptide repeat protein [Candidatus Litorirhabdus singularis]|nr:tetratricopeptide repeat protein [Candidatus Litorirhabdus singularis]
MLQLIRRARGPLLMVCLCGLLAACGGSEERETKYMERAQEHFDAGNYEKATLDVKNVLQINSKNNDARFLSALIAEEQQEWRKVFGALNLVVEQDPSHIEANIKLAQLSLALNDLEKSRGHAEKALELSPDNAKALGVLAGLEAKGGDLQKAEEYALQALQVNPAEVSAIAIMVGLKAKEAPDEALAFVDAGIAAEPEIVSLHKLRMQILEFKGDSDAVIAEYKLLMELEPENYTQVAQFAEYYVQKFMPDEAEQLLRGAVEANPEADELKIHLARYLLKHVSVEAAIAELESNVKEAPENFVLRQNLATALVSANDRDGAKKVLLETFDYDVNGASAQSARNALTLLARQDKDIPAAKKWIAEALEVEPENSGALLARASLKLQEGDFRGAIPDLRMVLRSTPDSVRAMLMLADAHQKDGSTSLALDNYMSVLQLAPDNTIALFQSARIMAARQDYDSAIENLENVLKQDASNLQSINLLTGIYSQQGRWDKAEKLLEQLAGDDTKKVLADLLSAGVELRRGDFDKTLELTSAVLKAQPDLLAAVPLAARAYAGNGDLDSGIALVDEYLQKFPEAIELYGIQGQLYLANQQPNESAAILEQSLEVAPQQVQTYLALARVYFMQGKRAELEDLYQRGIVANPDNVTLRMELALRFQERGAYDDALATLEEAYKLDESSQGVANNLAALLIDHYPSEENFRRAQSLTLGFEDSNSPALIDTVGWLQYHLGNVPQAISLLEAAQAAGGRGYDYFYHLGLAYAKNGDIEKAKQQLELVLVDAAKNYAGYAKAQEVYDSL